MRALFLLAAAALGAAAPSFAAPTFQPGAYVGVDAARASVSSRYVDDSNDISLGLTVGYQAMPNLAIEADARSLSFNPFRDLLAPAGYYPDQHYGIAAVGSAPLSDDVSIFVKGGVGSTRMHSTRSNIADRNETDPVIGIGVRYGFSTHWALNLEASRLTKTDVTLISLGVRYQF
jgi:opacity protein-like surface antigen